MVKKNERLKLNFTEDNWSFSRYSDFTIKTLTEAAEAFAAKFKVDAECVSFEFYASDSDYYNSGESYLTFKGWRWETDEEFEARVAEIKAVEAAERKRKADALKKKKEKEYEDYLRLKEKFEKGE